jgi:hypothetical protein
MARNVYRVVPQGIGWSVQIGGRTLGRWRSRDNALRRAQAWASADQPSTLVVHSRDGSVESEHPFGHDPHPAGG